MKNSILPSPPVIDDGNTWISVQPSEAANAVMFPLRLELRLDQREQMHRRRRQRQRHRQHRLQGNEADVDDDDIGPRGQALALEFANIGFFHRHDFGVVAQRGMQLAVTDIDGEDEARAVLQQHLGEAAGGRADVEADMVLDLDRILLQCAGELDAAARDIRVRGLRRQIGIG
jgi:hypothetical protein